MDVHVYLYTCGPAMKSDINVVTGMQEDKFQ